MAYIVPSMRYLIENESWLSRYFLRVALLRRERSVFPRIPPRTVDTAFVLTSEKRSRYRNRAPPRSPLFQGNDE